MPLILPASSYQYLTLAKSIGCPSDQVRNFRRARICLQPKQLQASAMARLCDLPDGPTAIGYGGARCGGKTFWMLAQMGVDDCQRFPGLKCLLLRKVGKSNAEHFEDLRHKLFANLPHEYLSNEKKLIFENGSYIILGHFQNEKDIDKYIGLEYDVIGIEEATTLTARKHSDIITCCRSSKVGQDGMRWRPRVYSTTNPGGIGHGWYRAKFILPFNNKEEKDTRFIPALVDDNGFINPEYRKTLDDLPGWQKRAWRYGDWDIAAGQFFTTFRRDLHVIEDFDESRACEWFAALDYGFTHYTAVLLGCKDGDGNIFIIDEHAERNWVPERHARAINEMCIRHNVCIRPPENPHAEGLPPCPGARLVYRNPDGTTRPVGGYCPDGKLPPQPLRRFVAGSDVFSRQSDGSTVAQQYSKFGIRLIQANTDRVQGWAEILTRLGDPDAGIQAKLFIHRRCARLLDCLPSLQHDPNHPEDVLKVNMDEDGNGGDDVADTLRYLVAHKPREIQMMKLTGL
ncbi:MAG: large terminase subunit [Verrucomicrobiales bacterium]|nr:large terminase subunit [Verrucomicrobiales bacterium]